MHRQPTGFLFDAKDRGLDQELRLQGQALPCFLAEPKKVARPVLDSLILKHEDGVPG